MKGVAESVSRRVCLSSRSECSRHYAPEPLGIETSPDRQDFASNQDLFHGLTQRPTYWNLHSPLVNSASRRANAHGSSL